MIHIETLQAWGACPPGSRSQSGPCWRSTSPPRLPTGAVRAADQLAAALATASVPSNWIFNCVAHGDACLSLSTPLSQQQR
eukprot:scaffold94572_cov14-Tisochrysis_lutea.AAC.2